MINVIAIENPKLRKCRRVASDCGVAYIVRENHVVLSRSSNNNGAACSSCEILAENGKPDLNQLLKNDAYEKRMQIVSGKKAARK